MTPLESAIAVCEAEAEYDVAAAARDELARLRGALIMVMDDYPAASTTARKIRSALSGERS